MESEIIVMLTHDDKTVQNALSVFESCKNLPVRYWGFKNVGLERSKMQDLLRAMKDSGKTTFLEVVSYSEEECMSGAKLAVEMGFDYLMGTVYHKLVFDYVKEKGIKFLPFCGKVSGSPSVLEGTIEEIIADGNYLLDRGVDGIDLLAFRHRNGVQLAEKFCSAITRPVVIAGSINSIDRIDFINRIKPWAFTMGSALFNKDFAPNKSFAENLEIVLEYMNSLLISHKR